MAFRWRADDGPILNGSFVIVQGIRTSIAKTAYICVIFKGGGVRTLVPPLDSPLRELTALLQLYSCCCVAVSVCLLILSVVCECGISWYYTLALFCYETIKLISMISNPHSQNQLNTANCFDPENLFFICSIQHLNTGDCFYFEIVCYLFDEGDVCGRVPWL